MLSNGQKKDSATDNKANRHGKALERTPLQWDGLQRRAVGNDRYICYSSAVALISFPWSCALLVPFYCIPFLSFSFFSSQAE
jgi:hypothetical protein